MDPTENNVNVFDPSIVNDDPITVDVLVGEGRKYKTQDELAKAYVNADSFIEQLKRDLATAKAEADVLKNTNAPNNNANGEADPGKVQTPEGGAPNAGGDDWRAKVREELQNLTQEDKYKNNILNAQAKTVEIFGSAEAAAKAIRDRANALNVSVKWLEETAATSPNAFYAAMEIQRQESNKSSNSPAAKSDIVVQPNTNGDRNFNYYSELRKTNLAKYYSPAVQKEMFEQAKKLGSAFYN